MNPMLDMITSSIYIAKLYEKSFDDIRKQYGMTQLEVDIIAFLKNNPELNTASDIIHYRMLPKANVSQAVELLIQRAFLKRSQDASDRRKIHLSILPGARKPLEEILNAQRQFTETLFGGFTEEERVRYMKMNQRISKNVREGLER